VLGRAGAQRQHGPARLDVRTIRLRSRVWAVTGNGWHATYAQARKARAGSAPSRSNATRLTWVASAGRSPRANRFCSPGRGIRKKRDRRTPGGQLAPARLTASAKPCSFACESDEEPSGLHVVVYDLFRTLLDQIE
jgi:hypothetical protein